MFKASLPGPRRDTGLLCLNVEGLPDFPGISRRQRLFAAASRDGFVPLASDCRDGSVSVDVAVAERHCLQRHAVAAGHFFWDVGAFGGIDRAADSYAAERFGDERTESRDAAGGDADAVFYSGPDGDSHGCI